MRILLVNKYFYRKGGAETYFFALAEGLRALGHEVAFFSMQHPNNEPSYWSKYFVSEKDYVGKISAFQKPPPLCTPSRRSANSKHCLKISSRMSFI